MVSNFVSRIGGGLMILSHFAFDAIRLFLIRTAIGAAAFYITLQLINLFY